MFVYVITNRTNDKRYVGQTVDIEKRIKAHRSCAERSQIARAIQKHGIDAFEVSFAELPQGSDRELLNEIERRLIRHFGTIAPLGYNMQAGGAPGLQHPDSCKKIAASKIGKPRTRETIEKVRASMKASPACRGWKTPEWQKQLLRDKFSGKPLSEATKEKLRAAWVRRRAEGTDTWESTPEQRAKLSAAMKGKTVPADTRAKISAALKGRSLSAETRAKMSANRKGRKLSDAHRLALSGRPCSPETKAKISAKKRERDAAQRAMAAA